MRTFWELIKTLFGKKLHRSVSLKLIVAIGVLILLGSGVFWAGFIIRGEKKYLQLSIEHAREYLKVTEVAIKSRMREGQPHQFRESVRDLIRTGVFQTVSIVTHPSGKATLFTRKGGAPLEIQKESAHCRLCHGSDREPALEAMNIEKTSEGRRLLLLRAIEAEKTCMLTCHQNNPSPVLGVIEAQYGLAPLDRTLKEQKIVTFVFGFILTAVCSVALCIILWNILIKHLYVLADAMDSVRKGNLDIQVPIKSRDEIGMLAQTFNSMIAELNEARQRLENWTKELEEEIRKKTEELRREHEQMIQTEKLASLGRLAAGVAHELNSPLTGIVTFAHLMKDRLPPDDKLNREDIEVIIEQADRCSKIIKGLLGFSRGLPRQQEKVDINASISQVVEMVRNQSKFHNIKIKTDFATDLPEIEADASQLQQVYMNLLINAADAMNDRGEIRIATRLEKENSAEFIEIEFTDNGPGIPDEHINRIFEPFFTTKPDGKGTGLGLAVSLGIVKKHGGYIDVKSKPGEGTSFFIRLPVQKEEHSET